MKRIVISLLILSAGFLCNAQVENEIMRAYQHLENKRYGEAWKIVRELISNKDIKGEDRELVCLIYSQSGAFYAQDLIGDDIGECLEAIEVCIESLTKCEERYVSVIKEREALAWNTIATNVYSLDCDSAYRCLDRAAKLYREMGDKKEEAGCVFRMASLKKHKVENDNALELYALAEKIAIESGDTSLVQRILHEWQKLLYNMGRMKERAEILGRMANVEQEDVSLIDEINILYLRGDDAERLGDYKMAEEYYKMVLQKSQGLHIKLRSTVMQQGLYALANLCYCQEKYAEALVYVENYLKISRLTNKSKEDYVLTYGLIADIYSKYGKEKETLQYLDSVDICVGDNVDLKIMATDNKCSCLMRFDMNERVIKLTESVDSIIVDRSGRYDSRRTNLLMKRGRALHNLGEYQKSADVYEECEKVTLKLYGEEANEHIWAMNGLANSMAFAGNIDGGAKKYVEMVKMMKRKVIAEMGSIAKSEKEIYLEYFSEKMRDMTSFGIHGKVQSDEFINTACEALIFTQSLLLESDVSLKELVSKKGTKQDKERLQIIIENEGKIKQLSKDFETNKEEIAKLKREAEKNEHLLCANFKEYEEYVSFLNLKLKDIIKAMPENSILIDFNDIKTAKKHFHTAFVTRRSSKKTDMKMVFDWESVEVLLDGAPIDVLYKDYMNDSARKLIWEPLSQYAEEGCTIYYVPAGKMHQISLESFTAPDGKLLGEHYKFVRLTSARELVRKHKNTNKPASAVLYGGLKYEMSKDSMLAESKKYRNAPLIAEYKRDVRGDSIFDELKYSQEEVDSIEYLLQRAGVNVVPYTGMQGNEESFIALSGNAPEMLHVATHGYYFTPVEAVTISYLKGCDDAMMLSGLVMSGANIAKKGVLVEEDVRDGLLSAGDISTMNLKGTDLVVLSACQTGLGKVTPEGVYGLQRAFKLAGVNTIVMTLWSVDDRVTKQFMVKFYEKLVENKWDKRESFNEARDYIRSLYPNSPYYWAGFVMVD